MDGLGGGVGELLFTAVVQGSQGGMEGGGRSMVEGGGRSVVEGSGVRRWRGMHRRTTLKIGSKSFSNIFIFH